MIKLTSLVGPMYIRKDSIVAITARYRHLEGDEKFTNVWIEGNDKPFNVVEDVETIYNLIYPKPTGNTI